MSIKNVTTFIFILFVTLSMAQNTNQVYLKKGTYYPTENQLSFDPASINPMEVVSNKYYRFIQFNSKLKPEDFKECASMGITLLEYIPDYTYLASIPVKVSKEQLTTLNYRSVFAIDPSFKMSSDVQSRSLPDWAIDGDHAKLLIKYFKDIDQSEIVEKLSEQKIGITHANGYNNYLTVSVPLDRMEELAALPYIEFVEAILPPDVKDDRRGRSLHRVNKLDPNYIGARNYTGKGINVLVRDDGKVFEHPDFKGRLNQDYPGLSDKNRDHGDGVAGIMAGNGNLDPINKGMAHESQVYVIDYVANFLDETMSLFFNQDVIVTNSSYSNGCNIGYTGVTEIVDQQTNDNPTLMHVFSAGNSGQGQFNNDNELVECGYGAGLTWGNITGGHKQGKNVLTTANLNYRGEIMTSSSRGPAHDGRIKPDIAANGNNHVSTAEGYGYFAFGGTSGAAPVVAGTMAMLHEAYEVNHGTRADAALLKAMILNTANDLGNKGPDFIHGWGSLNAYRAVLGIEEGRFLKETIQQDEQKSHTITIPENVAEVKIMTYWSDPEASAFSSFVLVNDLNTTLTTSNGEEFLPWVLDPTPDPNKLNAPAAKGIDNLNNMEQIAIDFPDAGEYTLEINGDQVPFGTEEYYVVWEFRMNEIDVIFPDGGENLNAGSSEVIHWDATGDEGEFKIFLIDEDGSETEIGNVPGHRRYLEWFTPNTFIEKASIKIERDGISDVSTQPFLLADNPTLLQVSFDENRNAQQLTWRSDSLPVSFNIYALGEFVMEKVLTVDSAFVSLQEHEMLQNNFVAVSANFPDGTEGKRSRAISTLPEPLALAANDVNDQPCVFKPVIYETQTTDTLLRYNWQFGVEAVPLEAETKGPHTVFYTKPGPNIAGLIVENAGGSGQSFFILNVQEELTSEPTIVTDEGNGAFTFSSPIKKANTYLWDFGDGNSAEGKTVNHTFEESGTFTVTLTAENACGSVSETSEVTISLTNTKELSALDFIISPNPTSGDFTITLPEVQGSTLDIKLYGLDGKLKDMRTVTNPTVGQRIGWQVAEKGTYVLRFSMKDKEIAKQLIVH